MPSFAWRTSINATLSTSSDPSPHVVNPGNSLGFRGLQNEKALLALGGDVYDGRGRLAPAFGRRLQLVVRVNRNAQLGPAVDDRDRLHLCRGNLADRPRRAERRGTGLSGGKRKAVHLRRRGEPAQGIRPELRDATADRDVRHVR